MSLPSTGDVDLALLVELVRAEKPVRRRESYDPVAAHFPLLTAEDRAKTRKNGVSKVFTNMLNWSRNRLRVRGLLVNGHAPGVWEASQGAREALVQDLGARQIPEARATNFIASRDTLADLLGREWARPLKLRDGEPEELPESPPEVRSLLERAAPTGDGGMEHIKQVVLDRLSKMPPPEFEQLVGRVLDSIGFRDTQVVGRSGDEGVDVIAYLYSPFVSAKIAFQVKRHAANVGPKDISYLRDRWARRADRLVLITTSDFTPGAREVASESGHDKPVDLVNGEQLIRVMIAHDLGVHTRPKVTYEIDDDYFSGV